MAATATPNFYHGTTMPDLPVKQPPAPLAQCDALHNRWSTSKKGNQTLRFDHRGGEVWLTVFPDHDGGFTACVCVAGQPHYLKCRDVTEEQAKSAALDWLIQNLAW